MHDTSTSLVPFLKNTENRYFWLFIFAHTLLWTLGPALARTTLPHDTLEGLTWGLQWQLGYNKHPFLTAWLCAGVTQLFGTVGWPLYLLAQVAVAGTFLAVWQLAKQILPSMHALIATLVLEGVLFYNINSFNFTPDTLQSPLWAFLSLFFYQAIVTQKIRYWLYTAFFAALCVCTKYQIVVLLLPLLLLCLFNTRARNSFRYPGIYYALLFFVLLITPHIIWLYQHDFITLTYAEKISSEYTQNNSTLQYILHPLNFLINGVLDVLGLFILLWPFYNKNKVALSVDHFTWSFLLTISLAPFILSLVLCCLTGDYFPPRWATPYFFSIGILVVAYLKPALSKKNLRQFAITLILFSLSLFAGRMISFSLYPRAASDAFLPNQEIALAVEKVWQEHYHAQLKYIAGSNYLVALITPYLSQKIKPYLSWDKKASPWINENELEQFGGIFIWDAGYNYTWDHNSIAYAQLPKSVLKRFPALKILPPYTFHRASNDAPVIIGIALLPPKVDS